MLITDNLINHGMELENIYLVCMQNRKTPYHALLKHRFPVNMNGFWGKNQDFYIIMLECVASLSKAKNGKARNLVLADFV